MKERAIACMGQIISHLGDHLQVFLYSCYAVFVKMIFLTYTLIFPSLLFNFSLIGWSLPHINLLNFELVPVNACSASAGRSEETRQNHWHGIIVTTVVITMSSCNCSIALLSSSRSSCIIIGVILF